MLKSFSVLSAVVLLFVPCVARDLYLLTGQSNMAGRGKVTDANRLSSARVWKWTAEGTWAEREGRGSRL